MRNIYFVCNLMRNLNKASTKFHVLLGLLVVLNENRSGDKTRQVSQVNVTDVLDYKSNI
jgi:hypothetical protein